MRGLYYGYPTCCVFFYSNNDWYYWRHLKEINGQRDIECDIDGKEVFPFEYVPCSGCFGNYLQKS